MNATLDLEHPDLWPWMDRSECSRDAYSDERDDVPRFFTALGLTQQKGICADCPVRPECVQYALDVETPGRLRHLDDIVYGGLTGPQALHLARRAARSGRTITAQIDTEQARRDAGNPCPVTDGDWTCPNLIVSGGLCVSHRRAQRSGRGLHRLVVGGPRVKGQKVAA